MTKEICDVTWLWDIDLEVVGFQHGQLCKMLLSLYILAVAPESCACSSPAPAINAIFWIWGVKKKEYGAL